ncbi:MAG: alpha/beta hydrolase [Sporichthyaceae bacterium]
MLLSRRAVVVVASLSLLAACGGSGDNAVPDGAAAPSSPEATTVETPSASATPSPTASAPTPDPAADAALARFYEQKLSWRNCDAGVQCASVTVPTNWAEPSGETIELAVNRVRARGGAERIGSLLINPGGPGAPGTRFLTGVADRFGADVRARYDIVGFDPRGVGSSAPVDCLTDRQLDRALSADPTPDDAADIADVEAQAKALAEGCAAKTGSLIGHVDTESVARDIDVLRALFGDDRLNWLGYSYGTYIGATYARLFPSRVGRMVLDAVVDPALSNRQILLGQAKGFEIAFSAFVADCLKNKPCAIGKSDGEVRTRLAALLKKLDAKPIKTRSGRDLNEALATLGLLYGMYAEFLWPEVRAALSAAYAGDGSRLLTLADQYADRGLDGRYANNSAEAIYAVTCLDHPDRSSVADIQAVVPEFEAVSPLFGQFIAWGALPCAYWPVSLDRPAGPVRAPGALPILVLGTTNDPATPYEWSVNLAKQLESGVLLTREGDGHTAHGSGNRCIDKAIDAYLVTGKTPPDGKRC